VDTVTITNAGDPTTWRVTARLTRSGTTSTSLQADAEPLLKGIVDADGDGHAEVFLRTHAGASTEFMTPLRLVGTTLMVVRRGPGPAQLGAGGSVTHGDGFTCTDAVRSRAGRELLVYQGESTDAAGKTWDGTVTTYGWSGATLVRLTSKHEHFSDARTDDPRVAPYYSVDCGSLTG
jgi:hypothetical protein